MVNESESLINVVIDDKPKMLRGLTKGMWLGEAVPSSPDADMKATGGEAGPTPCVVHMRNVVNRPCSCSTGKLIAKSAGSMVGKG
jgi:hypothetical protein